jgi:hypothetical protein
MITPTRAAFPKPFEPLIKAANIVGPPLLTRLSTAILIALGGCSLSDHITRAGLDYNRVLEDVTDNMLVTNILLARDQAPLHFTDLSQIRGSLQVQGQLQATAPFGQQYDSSTRVRDIIQATLGVTTNPTFDLVPLNTKDFTTGITSPINFKFLWYYFNRGADAETIISLLIEKLDVDEDFPHNQLECEFVNHPNTTFVPAPSDDTARCTERAHRILAIPGSNRVTFQDLVQLLTQLDFTSVKNQKALGPDEQLPSSALLKGAGALTTAGLDLEKGAAAGSYHLTKKSTSNTICIEPNGARPWIALRVTALGDAVDRTPTKDTPVDLCAPEGQQHALGRTSTVRLFLYMRSVEAMFQYLGRMLTYNPDDRALPFYLRDRPDSTVRLRVQYRDGDYYIDNAQSSCGYLKGEDPSYTSADCTRNPHFRGDQTLFILSVLNQLLNLYKTSSEIPTTPAVQAVP